MKNHVKASFSRLFAMLLVAGLCIFAVSGNSFAAAPKIGESYGGGVVFYLDSTGEHGLIAARSDAKGHSLQKEEGFHNWYSASNGATEFLEGFSNWTLPNKEQLNQLYLHRREVGGFTETVYWSSSEGNADEAWAQSFGNGQQVVGKKTNGSHVRAIRSF
ncbi:MAG: DUF1566 domain-containing protein [Chlorobiaceae bacterium]